MHRLSAVLALAACVADDLDGDGIPAARDCNDGDPAQLLPVDLYVDGDGDGFGGQATERGCAGSAWLVETSEDCDDADPSVFPGSLELGCDGRDNDCNPVTVDGPAYTIGATWNSVQDAVDRVGFNETVFLCGSTIRESITTWRPATVQGAGSGRTILDGSGEDRATIEVRAPLVLSGISVVGGAGSPAPGTVDGPRYGGGIAAFDVASLVLDDVRLSENEADRGGGLAVVGTGGFVATGLRIEANRGVWGGGVYLDPGVGSGVRLDDTTIVGNVAELGGGVWLRGALDGESLRILDNRAGQGGGVHLEPGAVLSGAGTAIAGNSAVRTGGGVEGGGTVSYAAIEHNAAAFGGGVFAVGDLWLEGVSARANTASADGGALAVGVGTVSLTGGALVGNVADGRGGGLHGGLGGVVSLVDVVLDGNVAWRGAGLSCEGCVLDGLGVELRGGSAADGGGGVASQCGAVSLTESVLSDNNATDGAGVWVGGGMVRLESVVSSGNLSVAPGATFVVRAGCEGGLLVGVDVAVDPADRVAVGAVPAAAVPGPTFTCIAADKGEGCAAP